MDNRNVITKSNYLIEAGYKLNLNEQRLVLACISKIDSKKELPENIRIDAKDFAKQYGIRENKAYQYLAEAVETLAKREIKFIDSGGKLDWHINWLSDRAYAHGEGYILVTFSQKVGRYLALLEGEFTSYKASLIRHLNSSYSIRIFEFLIRWKDTGFFTIKLDDFKEKLELKGKYNRFSNLKSRVIEPAIKELQAHCNMNITYTTKKNGRTIDRLEFSFSFNKQQAFELN